MRVDSERKIPCRTRESNLHQRCAGLMLYQLSYIPTNIPPNSNKHDIEPITIPLQAFTKLEQWQKMKEKKKITKSGNLQLI